MPRLIIGKTPEQLEEERALKQRELEREIQQAQQEQEYKLRMLLRKKKKNRVLVILLIIIVLSALIGFGTYNTFIKHTLNENDVRNTIEQTVSSFPTAGLDGYITDNFPTWLETYMKFNYDGSNIDKVEVVPESIAVDLVRQINSMVAKVYFSADIKVTEKDEKDGDGKVVKQGEVKTTRYSFVMPIEQYYKYNKNGQPTVNGYRPLSTMSIYTLKNINKTEVAEHELLKFPDEKLEDKAVEPIKIKVDKTLSDLFAGRDTSQDFYNYLKFNNYGAEYLGLNSFEYHNSPNKLGYNALVTYSIKTKEGFEYQNTTYLVVVKNGKTWTINGVL